MSVWDKRLDELDIELNSRSALNEYCERVRSLSRELSTEFRAAGDEVRKRLTVTPLNGFHKAMSRRVVAKIFAVVFYRMADSADVMAKAAVKIPRMFEMYYIGETVKAKGIEID